MYAFVVKKDQLKRSDLDLVADAVNNLGLNVVVMMSVADAIGLSLAYQSMRCVPDVIESMYMQIKAARDKKD